MPLVSIGLPVYNGEKFLGETINSILNQTFADFELVISDNASTDGTGAICQFYAKKDKRIRYFRNTKNLGAAKNYNQVFQLSKGKYFKWAAHDDLLAPLFLERCIEILQNDPSIILCYTRTKEIDENGVELCIYEAKPNFCSDSVTRRFFEVVCTPHPQTAVFGVIRSNILKKTRLIGAYSSSDRILLGELALLGRFYEVSDYLFFKRIHPDAHWRKYPTRQMRQLWYDPQQKKILTFPHWKLLSEHFKSLFRYSLKLNERIICSFYMLWWIRLHWRYLATNLILKEPKRNNNSLA